MKLGLYPFSKAILVAISTSQPKATHRSIAIEDSGNCFLLDYAFYMYWKQFEILPLGLALKLGSNPVAIVV
jgi:hypothetical protein